MFKRFLSLLLVLAMVTTMVPVQVFASETREETVAETSVPETVEPETEATETAGESVPETEPETTAAVTEPEQTLPEETRQTEATEPEETLPSEETLPAEETAPDVDVLPTEEASQEEQMDRYVRLLGKGYCGAGKDGVPGKNLSWYFYEDGTLEIKGTGDMMDYEYTTFKPENSEWAQETSTAPWTALANQNWVGIRTVELPGGLTGIGNYAFAYSDLETITLPQKLKRIGESAFTYAYLTEVAIPDSVTEIGKEAFWYCYRLERVTLPAGLTVLEESAFAGCRKLGVIALPDSLREIGDYAFSGCEKLQSVTIPENVTRIGGEAFYRTGLTGIVLPASVEEVGGWAFASCSSLEEAVISSDVVPPDAPSGTGRNLFYGSALKKVTFLEGCTEIPEEMLYGARELEICQLPEGLIKIGTCAFWHCEKLWDIQLPSTLESIGSSAFKSSGIVRLNIPDSVEWMGSEVFEDCVRLEEVTIPKTTELGNWRAFKGCVRLKRVVLPDQIGKELNETFQNCESLEYVHIPDTVTEIDYGCFVNCRSLKEINLPESVTSIRSGAFRDCDSLKRVITTAYDVDDYAFAECDNLVYFEFAPREKGYHIAGSWFPEGFFQNCRSLRTVVMHGTLTRIMPYAFAGCDSLESISYIGSEENWNKIEILEYNEPLNNAKIHFNGELDSGSCGEDSDVIWSLSADKTLHIMGTGEMPDYSGPKEAPWLFYEDLIEKIVVDDGITHVGAYAFCGLDRVPEVRLPGTLTWIGHYAFDGCTGLEAVHFKGPQITWDKVVIGIGNDSIKPEIVHAVPVEDFFDNQNITINYQGSAIAYYKTYPDTSVIYRFQGEEDYTIVHSNKNGIFSVPLKHGDNDTVFDEVGREYVINIEILRVDDAIFADPVPMTAVVKVEPLSFTQEWKISFDSKVGAAISEGASIDIGIAGLEASSGSIGAEATIGRSMKISREYTPTSESLELTSDVRGGVGLELSAGVKGEVGPVELSVVGISSGIKSTASGTYGLKTDKYSPDDRLQQRAIGTFFLGELIMTQCQSNPAMWDLYNFLIAQNVYEGCGCDYIRGGSLEIEVQTANEILNAKIKGGELFGDIDATAGLLYGADKLVFAAEYQGSPGEEFKTKMGISTGREIDLLKGSVDLPQAGTEWLLRSSEVELSYDITQEDQELELSLLRERNYQNRPDGIGKESFSLLDKYTFKMRSLIDYDFGSRFSDNKLYSGFHDLVQVAEAVAGGEIPLSYETAEKREEIIKAGLDFGIGAGLNLDVGMEAAYITGTEVVTSSGFLTADGPLVNARSEGLTEAAKAQKRGFLEIYLNAVASLATEAVELFISLGKLAFEGVELVWCTIFPNLEAENLEYTVTTQRDDTQAASYMVRTLDRSAAQFASVEDAQENTRDRRTVGRSVLIDTRAVDSGEAVSDFSETPLTIQIRYSEADLDAAGLSKSDEIAMYRYSEEGDYFEFIGGVQDANAMSVTARITRPGQYVLAADSCAPQISAMEMSDFGTAPTVTAYVNDLSGLDVSRFVFILDGQVRVDGSNIADHFDAKLGKFTYRVEGFVLEEGRHAMSFTLADTTGNSATYDYTFVTDVTMPEIRSASVTGTVNKNGLVEIRADVFDKNLAGVRAVFSRQKADGTWSAEAAADMVQQEDGLWILDYEGEGIPLKVFVQAMDTAGNITVSETVQIDPCVESLEIQESYIALRKGRRHTLAVRVTPEAAATAVTWSSDNESIVTVDDSGNLRAVGVGTAYITASVQDGEKTLTDSCRVDVKSAPTLDGIQLSAASATVELFRRENTTLDVLLKMPQNYFASEEAAPEDLGAAIEAARFEDDRLNDLFLLVPMDDRSLCIYPSDYAVKNPGEVAGSYKTAVTVTVWGKEYTSETLTLKVKKSVPKLKATVAAFNSFYTGQTQPITVTGGTVTAIRENQEKNTAKTGAVPEWLMLEEGNLVLSDKALAKSVSGKAYLLVDTEEWRIPAAVTLSVKNTYKVPGVKLSATAVTVPNLQEASAVELKLLCTNKADTLADLNITGIAAPEGYSAEDFDPRTGTFVLRAGNGFKPGKLALAVSFGDRSQTLTLTVKTQAVKLKLSASKVTLNKKLDNAARIDILPVTKGYALKNSDVVIGAPAQILAEYANGRLTVKLNQADDPDTPENEAAAYGKTYKVTVCAYEGAPAVTLNVAVPAEKKSNVTASIKAAGTIDVIRAGSAVTVTPTFTNAFPADVDDMDLNFYRKSGKTWEKMTKDIPFRVEKEAGKFRITGAEGLVHTDKYRVELTALVGGTEVLSKQIDLKLKMGTAKLTLTAPDTILFGKDRHDRVTFSPEKQDSTLNDIAKVEIRDAKYQELFEVFLSEDGRYTVGFTGDSMDKKLMGKTLTLNLNVFLEGNETTKANATVKLKLTIAK